MSFAYRLFTLFLIANIFSANINSSIVFADEPDTKVNNEIADNEQPDENTDKGSKSELRNAGFVSIHSENCAFSYELDNDGNIKNVKDLLAGDMKNTNSEINDNQNVDGVCVYSSCSRFEVFSGDGIIEVKKSNQEQEQDQD